MTTFYDDSTLDGNAGSGLNLVGGSGIEVVGEFDGSIETYTITNTGGGGGGITELTGDVTASGSGSVVASIASGVIVNADVSPIAAIALTKLANMGAGKILSGNAGGVVTAQTPSGDVSMNNSAVFSVTDLTMAGEQNGDLLYRTGGVWARLPAGTNGQVLTMVAGEPAWA